MRLINQFLINDIITKYYSPRVMTFVHLCHLCRRVFDTIIGDQSLQSIYTNDKSIKFKISIKFKYLGKIERAGLVT